MKYTRRFDHATHIGGHHGSTDHDHTNPTNCIVQCIFPSMAVGSNNRKIPPGDFKVYERRDADGQWEYPVRICLSKRGLAQKRLRQQRGRGNSCLSKGQADHNKQRDVENCRHDECGPWAASVNFNKVGTIFRQLRKSVMINAS
jgi:hypothetical protein